MPIALRFPWLSWTLTPRNLGRVASFLDAARPDVLHLHNHMFDLSAAALRERRRRRRPLLLTLHTVIRHRQIRYNLLLRPADRLLLRHLVVRRCEGVLCPDLNVQRYAREAFGVDEGHLVPYGIDLPTRPAPAEVEALRQELGLAGRRVILSLGHVHEIRDRVDLVSALPEVLRAIPEAALVVVGAISTPRPAELARRLGVEHALVLAGPRPHAQVPALLALADLEAHWLNQEDAERTSLGIASLEAMAAGRAVIAAANPDTYGRGVLRDGENVVIVERGRPDRLVAVLIGLLRDDARRERIGQAAHETVRQQFSWDAVCARTLDIYRGAMASCAA